jgi:hypothetical protein
MNRKKFPSILLLLSLLGLIIPEIGQAIMGDGWNNSFASLAIGWMAASIYALFVLMISNRLSRPSYLKLLILGVIGLVLPLAVAPFSFSTIPLIEGQTTAVAIHTVASIGFQLWATCLALTIFAIYGTGRAKE